jgi:hypothetical protein
MSGTDGTFSNSLMMKGIAFVNPSNMTTSATTFSQSPPSYITGPVARQTSGAVSISAWIYPQNNGKWGNTNDYWENIVSGGTSTSACGGSFILALVTSTRTPSIGWQVGSANYEPNVRLTPNAWQNIVAVFDGSHLSTYLNGQLVGTPMATSASLSAYNSITMSGPVPTSSSAGCNPISGKLADVKIFNSTLTPQEIEQGFLEGMPLYSRLNVSVG